MIHLFAALLMTTSHLMPQTPYPTLGKIEVFDKALESIVDPGAPIEIVADGLQWAEGPVWVKDGSYLLFSDPKQNTIFKWSEQEGMLPFLKPSGYTGTGRYSDEPGSNGLLINHDGELVACEHGDRRVTRMKLQEGEKVSIADRWEGKRFNSPNDICQHSDGTYYFTDPPYGLPGREKDSVDREIEQNGVYRAIEGGTVTQIIGDLDRPNGIALSEDEKVLYVAQSDAKAPYIMAYELAQKDMPDKGLVFFDFKKAFPDESMAPDGMKVDRQGNLYIGAGNSIVVVSKEGKALGRIHTGVKTANCAFGEDGYLYLTASQYILRVKLNR